VTLLERNDIEYLKRHLSLGELVLFTGAGFSVACTNRAGTSVPTGAALREAIWPHAFPGEDFDASEPLGEIFEVAQRQDRNGLRKTLESLLTIEADSIPQWYRRYMRGPWHRVYTLNFDNFWDLAPQLDPNARSLTAVSALSDEALPPDSTAAVVHLNGRLKDFPNVTFSPRQYGERQATADKWYAQLTSDLFGHPIVFVGTELNEPPFWEYLALRRMKTGRGGERRPKSFLVSPSLGAAKRQLLKDLNIVFVAGYAEDFAEQVLEPLEDAAEAGRKALTARRSAPSSPKVIEEVGTLRAAPPPSRYDAADFLLGRQPIWHDLDSGYVVERDFDRELAAALADPDNQHILVTGTAGAGKSTSLLRSAGALHADGRRVLWFDGKDETELRLYQLRNRVRDAKAEFLFVDDADSFGPVSGQFLRDVAKENTDLRIVAGVRANRLRGIGLEPGENIDALELTVPGLTDSDIDRLIDALDAANRLGFLKGKPHSEQRQIFRRSFDRQLIVAMIEATSGERFDELIRNECSELTGVAYELYAMTCFVTVLGFGIRREELLLALGGDNAEALGELQRLLDRRLLVSDDSGLIRARHRVIGEHALTHVKTSGHMANVIEGLAFAFATKVGPGHDTRSREHRLLSKLINHDFLIEQIGDPQQIRPIYALVEDIMRWDFHYWLQRGSYEVERGSISHAENFLAQATSLAPDNLFVRTEWAYMVLVKAAGEAEGGVALHREHADEAFAQLAEIIDTHGARTPYPFHVLARQGMQWLDRATLSDEDRAKYLGQILSYIRDGMKRHPRSRELRTIEKNVETAYLSMAVAKP
jgi:hypothetical protein